MTPTLDQISNTPGGKFEKIKELLNKGGSLKEGIKDEKGNLQIFMEGDKIIGLNDVYDLKIIAKTIIGDIDTKVLDIVIIGDKVKISTDKGPGEISKNQFNTAIEGRIKTGSYISDINGNHIEFKKVATINRPNPKILEAARQGKTAEVQGNSEAQRQVLIEEVEKQGVSINLIEKNGFIKLDNNSITNIEKQVGTFGALGDKLSGIFDALMKGFDLILEGKFTEGFAAIMAGFTGKKEKEKKETDKNDNGGNNKNEEVSKFEKGRKDSFVSMFLTKTYKDKDKIQTETMKLIPSIIENPIIQLKKFNELKSLTDINNKYYINHSGIAKEVGMNYSDGGVFFAMHSIIVKEKLINELIGKENKDWRNLSIKEIFALIGPHLNRLSKLNKIESFEDLDKINLGISINKDGKIEGELSDSNFLLKNKDLLTPTLIQKIKSSLGNFNDKNDVIKLSEEEYTKEQKDLLINIIYSGKGIEKDLSNSSNFAEFNLGFGEKFKEVFQNKPLNLSESFDLILITGGKKISELNSIEKSIFYIKLIKILRDKNPDFAGEYGSELTKGIYDNTYNKIPNEVKDTVKTLSSSLVDISMGFIEKEFTFLWGVAKNNPELSALIIGLVSATMFIGGKVLAVRSMALAIIIASLSGVKIAGDVSDAIKKEKNNPGQS